MSDYERNKGKLIPVTESIEEVAERVVTDRDYYYDSADEQFMTNPEEYGHVFIGQRLFKVEFEDTSDDPDFTEVTHNEDGSISFHTYHYNGGAHWTELLEDKV